MSDLHLLDIRVRPCAYVKDVIQGSWRNVQEGVERGNGKKIYGFKVVGENRIITVLDSGVESAMTMLNAAYGDQLEITCSPLRTYEGFAEHVLGVDRTLCAAATRRLTADGGKLYWLHFTVDYKGMSAVELMAIWGREATTALSLRSRGDMELDLFKVVSQREVHCFIKAPDAEIMDDITFTLPIMKELGDQVKIVAKSIIPIVCTPQ